MDKMGFYKIITYGCQMNFHESEKIAGMLEHSGYKKNDETSACDIIVFNTCCIRENAENTAYGNIGALKKLKNKNKDLIIAVGGCMTQQRGAAEKLIKTLPFVDIIFGTHNIKNLPKLLEKRITDRKKTIEITEDDGQIFECGTAVREKYPCALVNIIYGCDNFCSYCIVPYVRGREKCRNFTDILNEIEFLVKNGYKEITLLGQNVNSYNSGGVDFSDLLKMIERIEGKFRIRFMTSHPKDFSDKLLQTIKNSEKICKSIHLPMQSGSTEILAKMNRKYTAEQYLAIINKIKAEIPEAAISTDIMVGFPGETEKHFQETLRMVEKCGFHTAFTFVYSRRSGTKAYDLPEQTDAKTSKRRIVELIKLHGSIAEKYLKELYGKPLEVLCEGYDKQAGAYFGRTDANKMLYFNSDKNVIGSFCNIIMHQSSGIGEIV